MIRIVRHTSAQEFLDRSDLWLTEREAELNLVLSLALALAAKGELDADVLMATVEDGDDVVGCALRTPPHKLLVTDMPVEAAGALVAEVAEIYDEIPAVLGPPDVAEAIATSWVARRGGGWRPGMEQGIYRLDSVVPPSPTPGSLRLATEADVDMAVEWGVGFARDTGVMFPTSRASIEKWIAQRSLHIWEDGGAPVCITVAQGSTGNGVRIGYVYTPPEARKRGYASALVARVSQMKLDEGVSFCVLYTDMSNPTSNAIYQRLGYELIAEVRDFDIIAEEGT